MKKQLELLRALEELDMNLRDFTAPDYRKIGFKPPTIDFRNSVEAKRKELGSKIEPKLLEEYERIRNRYGTRVVVQVINEFCGGCFVRLPSELISRRQSDIITCPNCGRFLYLVR